MCTISCWAEARHDHSPQKRITVGGFTLLETMVVLLLVSLLIGFALIDVQRATQRTRLTTAARQVAADLRLARIRAISLNANYRIHLPVGAGSYTRQRRGGSGYQDEGAPVPLPDGVVTRACTSPSGAISFRPRGLAGDFGTVTLANAAGELRRVIVAITGEVRVE